MEWSDIIIASIAALALGFSAFTYFKSQKLIRKQQFESTFFNMMKQLEDIVSKLTLEVIYDPVIREETINTFRFNHQIAEARLVKLTGRDVFECFYNSYKVHITGKDSFKKIYDLGRNDYSIFLAEHINIEPASTETNETITDYVAFPICRTVPS